MDCPSTPAAPLLALTLRYASHTTRFEIANGFGLDSTAGSSCAPSCPPIEPGWPVPFAPLALPSLVTPTGPSPLHAPRRSSAPHDLPRLGVFLSRSVRPAAAP